jgi:hypothetical protein
VPYSLDDILMSAALTGSPHVVLTYLHPLRLL